MSLTSPGMTSITGVRVTNKMCKKLVLASLAVLFLGSSVAVAETVDPKSAYSRAIKSMGLKPVSIDGPPLWGCGEGDSFLFNRKFTAVNPFGERVTGVICGNFFKNYTIRLD